MSGPNETGADHLRPVRRASGDGGVGIDSAAFGEGAGLADAAGAAADEPAGALGRRPRRTSCASGRARGLARRSALRASGRDLALTATAYTVHCTRNSNERLWEVLWYKIKRTSVSY